MAECYLASVHGGSIPAGTTTQPPWSDWRSWAATAAGQGIVPACVERRTDVWDSNEPSWDSRITPAASVRLARDGADGVPHADAEGITEELIRDVVVEFYRRARRDDRLGPVFEPHVHEWDAHLGRMTDFWSAALLRTGRYSGRPVERHRAIAGLAVGHFDRWVELFEATVRDLCPARRGRGVPRPRPADAGRHDQGSGLWTTDVGHGGRAAPSRRGRRPRHAHHSGRRREIGRRERRISERPRDDTPRRETR